MTIDNPAPIASERAFRFLVKENYFELRKILSVARIVSGILYAGLSEKELEQLLQTIYDEDHHTAYKWVVAAYRAMDNAVPKYIQAIYSFYPMWKVFMVFVYEATSDFRREQEKYRSYPIFNELIKQAIPAEPQ